MTELETRIYTAIADPGAVAGVRGERTLIRWQTDAVMKVIREDASVIRGRYDERPRRLYGYVE
jgi:hypothetical protein